MRAAVACTLAIALTALVTGAPLLPCPFLQGAGGHRAPCCPRENSQPSKCPLSRTLETCPYYMTEAKLGYVESPVAAALPPVARSYFAVPADARFDARRGPAWMESGADLHLRIRVLLI